ncbi:hypothetical protein B0A48_10875 [Cryoendolithus antarcticus]|uniref:Transmembrane protein n=1 Tax=Cryoendolithus antarcticus TaxID=1507870 RepID=A0A1V8SYV7_9PEZI|nr:hypothetical protein B0A48_10875 [Cryoendolithus antarcticus]
MASDLATYKPEVDVCHDTLHHTSWFIFLNNIISIMLTLACHIAFFLGPAAMTGTPISDCVNAIGWIAIILVLFWRSHQIRAIQDLIQRPLRFNEMSLWHFAIGCFWLMVRVLVA